MLTDTRRQEHHDAPYAVRTLTGPASTRLHLEAVPREVPPRSPAPPPAARDEHSSTGCWCVHARRSGCFSLPPPDDAA